MSLHQRRDVLETLAALFGTTSVAGLPFRDDNGDVLTGVVDRIVDDLAVILLEDDGELVDQTTLPVEDLPGPAGEEGSVLTLVMDGDEIDRVRYDKPETKRRRADAEDRFDEIAD